MIIKILTAWYCGSIWVIVSQLRGMHISTKLLKNQRFGWSGELGIVVIEISIQKKLGFPSASYCDVSLRIWLSSVCRKHMHDKFWFLILANPNVVQYRWLGSKWYYTKVRESILLNKLKIRKVSRFPDRRIQKSWEFLTTNPSGTSPCQFVAIPSRNRPILDHYSQKNYFFLSWVFKKQP